MNIQTFSIFLRYFHITSVKLSKSIVFYGPKDSGNEFFLPRKQLKVLSVPHALRMFQIFDESDGPAGLLLIKHQASPLRIFSISLSPLPEPSCPAMIRARADGVSPNSAAVRSITFWLLCEILIMGFCCR